MINDRRESVEGDIALANSTENGMSDSFLAEEGQHEVEQQEKAEAEQEKILAPMLRDRSPEARAARRRFMFRAVCGEFVGSTLLFFIVCSIAVHTHRNGNNIDFGSASLLNALGSIMAVMPLVYAFADISGAHFNPAISFACWITKRTSNRKFVLFVIAQLLGSCLAMILLWAVFPEDQSMFKQVIIVPQKGADRGRVFAMEFFLTFVLVFTVFTLVFDDVETTKRDTMTFRGIANSRGLTIYAPTPQSKTGFAPISISFLVGALSIFGGTVSGGAFNPARMFGPAVFSGIWTDLWLYWIAHILGATVAALLRAAFTKFGLPSKDLRRPGVFPGHAPHDLHAFSHPASPAARRNSDVDIHIAPHGYRSI